MLPFTLLYLSTSPHWVTPALSPERAMSALPELILSLGGVSYKYFWKQVVTTNNRISGSKKKKKNAVGGRKGTGRNKEKARQIGQVGLAV
jgi:hypothetical protein